MTQVSPRQAIRRAFQVALQGPEDGPPPTHAARKVYASRATRVPPKLLPVALVYTRDERRDRAMGGGVIRRFLEVVAEVAASGDDADDQVDILTTQVEAVLDANPTLGGAVESIEWQSTEADYDGEGDAPLAAARITFQAVYYTVPPEEEAPPRPGGVYVSWAPDIGLPHEPDYVDLADTPLPDVTPNDGVS